MNNLKAKRSLIIYSTFIIIVLTLIYPMMKWLLVLVFAMAESNCIYYNIKIYK